MRDVLVFEEELVDESGEAAPPFNLALQLAFAAPGDGVELRFAVALRPPPGSLDPALLLEADERGIQRALIEGERMVRDLRQARGQRIRMQRPHGRQGAQDDEVEGALEQLDVPAFT